MCLQAEDFLYRPHHSSYCRIIVLIHSGSPAAKNNERSLARDSIPSIMKNSLFPSRLGLLMLVLSGSELQSQQYLKIPGKPDW